MAELIPMVISGLPLRAPHVGVGVYTRRLIQGMQRHAAAEVSLLVLVPEGTPANWLPWLPESQIERVPEPPSSVPSLLRDAWLFDRLVRQARHRHPDAIFFSPTAVWAAHRHPRDIIMMHDCIYRLFPRYLGKRFLRRRLILATERYGAGATHVVTCSRSAAHDLTALAGVPTEKIEVIYNWVGPEFEPARARAVAPGVTQKYGLPERYWLYLGGYDYRKNVELLIRAYAQTRKKLACPPLVLAGRIPRDPGRPFCDVDGALRETGLGKDAVVRPGMIDEEDLPGLYAQASLLIYPSLYEGFGLPPAEAMAVGTPLLSSNTSSLPEIVLNPDCLFAPNDLLALVQKLTAAVGDPARFKSALPPALREDVSIPAYVRMLRNAAPPH